jgi:hypothetical protein
MPAAIGVSDLFGMTAPAGGHVSESSQEETQEIATIKDASGVTVIAKPKPLVRTETSIKGYGDPAFAAVTAGALTADTLKIVSAKGSESNDDFPQFEIRAVKLANA